jgi:hypothetical protein
LRYCHETFGNAKGKSDALLDDEKRIDAMKFLIDTHTFLWFLAGSLELSETVKKFSR